MATKTITLELDAYEKLRSAKKVLERVSPRSFVALAGTGRPLPATSWEDCATSTCSTRRAFSQTRRSIGSRIGLGDAVDARGRRQVAEGFDDDRREDCERFLSVYEILWPEPEVAWIASRIARQLQAEGRTIGDHDAWIAAFAVRHQEALVTRNSDHFGRVAGLRLSSY